MLNGDRVQGPRICGCLSLALEPASSPPAPPRARPRPTATALNILATSTALPRAPRALFRPRSAPLTSGLCSGARRVEALLPPVPTRSSLRALSL